ncbi:5'-AMP-activated protein kinase subunit beta-2 isoform X5 [Ambystoma mexicanum]|uniref:5'-AMP-activated protein kinase subunit beta-2 isoform X5 n=1 Tax=Ambystoma mexicanum TaxID=8296 RepID=UPI0037E7AA1C
MGNTTSDRVSGERHGSKQQRSDGGACSQSSKEQEQNKIMVGSTDDPNIFSTQESKLLGDKEFVSWQSDSEDGAKTTQQARPTVIRWGEGGKEVFISGSFNNWNTKIPMIKSNLDLPCCLCCNVDSHNDFVAILDLPEGEHQYKFFVDGQWVHDPSEMCPALHQDYMAKNCMSSDLRNASNPHPFSHLTSYKSFLIRTLIFHVILPFCQNPTMSCSTIFMHSQLRMV